MPRTQTSRQGHKIFDAFERINLSQVEFCLSAVISRKAM
jgi:hypothetical protein